MPSLLKPAILLRLGLFLVLVPLLGLAPFPLRARQNMENARRLMETGTHAQAAASLAAAASQLPARADLWRLAGENSLEAGEPVQAGAYFEKAIAIQPEINALLGLGDARQQEGRLSAAIQAWEAAMHQQGPSAQAMDRLWKAHLALGDYPAALQELETLLSLQPQDAGLRYRYALLLATQDPERSLPALDQAAALDPAYRERVEPLRREIRRARVENQPAYSLAIAGRALAGMGEWQLAEEAFRQATVQLPDYAEAWAYLGEAIQHRDEPLDKRVGSREEALSALQKALQLDPRSVAAHSMMALYLERQLQLDQALEQLQAAADLDPNNPSLRVSLGGMLAKTGDLDAALLAFQQAVTASHDSPAFLRQLVGFCLQYDYQVREVGLPAARRAAALAPTDPLNLDLMGQVFTRLEDFANARRFLDSALVIDGEFPPAHLHLGFLYLMTGENGLAYRELERARSLAPQSSAGAQAARLLEKYFP